MLLIFQKLIKKLSKYMEMMLRIRKVLIVDGDGDGEDIEMVMVIIMKCGEKKLKRKWQNLLMIELRL
jgi:hypothetical protein